MKEEDYQEATKIAHMDKCINRDMTFDFPYAWKNVPWAITVNSSVASALDHRVDPQTKLILSSVFNRAKDCTSHYLAEEEKKNPEPNCLNVLTGLALHCIDTLKPSSLLFKHFRETINGKISDGLFSRASPWKGKSKDKAALLKFLDIISKAESPEQLKMSKELLNDETYRKGILYLGISMLTNGGTKDREKVCDVIKASSIPSFLMKNPPVTKEFVQAAANAFQIKILLIDCRNLPGYVIEKMAPSESILKCAIVILTTSSVIFVNEMENEGLKILTERIIQESANILTQLENKDLAEKIMKEFS